MNLLIMTVVMMVVFYIVLIISLLLIASIGASRDANTDSIIILIKQLESKFLSLEVQVNDISKKLNEVILLIKQLESKLLSLEVQIDNLSRHNWSNQNYQVKREHKPFILVGGSIDAEFYALDDEIKKMNLFKLIMREVMMVVFYTSVFILIKQLESKFLSLEVQIDNLEKKLNEKIEIKEKQITEESMKLEKDVHLNTKVTDVILKAIISYSLEI